MDSTLVQVDLVWLIHTSSSIINSGGTLLEDTLGLGHLCFVPSNPLPFLTCNVVMLYP
jgi:hypothetical protein